MDTLLINALRMTSIRSRNDLANYIRLLAERGMLYHWDDDPRSIIWSDGPLTDPELAEMVRLHDEAWKFDPWGLLDDDRSLFNLYVGGL